MNEMLAAVTRAIKEFQTTDTNDLEEWLIPMTQDELDSHCALIARTVIETMREPTKEMVNSGFEAGQHELWSEPGYHEGETLTYLENDAPKTIWQAMIKKILE